MRERLLTDLKRSAEEFPRFALKMVQALFPPPAVGLIAPEAVVENGGWIGAAVEASLPEAAVSQCYEFEQSVAFLVLTPLAAAAVLGYACALVLCKRRLTGMDVLSALLVGAGVIRFIPKVWDALHLHGLDDYSQSGCKIAMYTTVGMPHVVSFIVTLIAFLGMRIITRGGAVAVADDVAIRSRLGWILLFLSALEGATGMVPAIYTDLADDKSRCGLTHGIGYDGYSNAIGHMFLVSVLPYLVPFAAMIYPIAVTFRALKNATKDLEGAEDDPEGDLRKDELRTRATLALTIAATYVATHLPLAVTALVTYPLIARGDVYLDWPTLCQFESVFHFMEEAWLLMVPTLLLARDKAALTRRARSGIARLIPMVDPRR